jgi:hypothetical protein
MPRTVTILPLVRGMIQNWCAAAFGVAAYGATIDLTPPGDDRRHR